MSEGVFIRSEFVSLKNQGVYGISDWQYQGFLKMTVSHILLKYSIAEKVLISYLKSGSWDQILFILSQAAK